ncbi:GtrA family protein [Shewanella sp. 10N.7]|uniref:GtrA family protein n=1 Tax=Shewanella sp. 10N.7 TaxID=2885093 RepID=UPI001E5F277C|nr:GtrA family protein [Shewanella sp. 10N.7]MCC4833686.1 GtrA family protein [Shewanella sp. 10N.7]
MTGSSISAVKMNPLVSFLLVGGGSFIVDLSIYLSLIELAAWQPFVARTLAFMVGLGLTWFGNRKFTFRERSQLSTLKQCRWVITIAAISALANLGAFHLMRLHLLASTLTLEDLDLVIFTSNTLTGIQVEIISFAVGVLVGLIVNWLGSNHFTFKNQPA